MEINYNALESIWDALLSRQPDQVKQAFQALSPEEQVAIRNHLQKMAEEEGWHPEQRKSAQEALRALELNHDE